MDYSGIQSGEEIKEISTMGKTMNQWKLEVSVSTVDPAVAYISIMLSVYFIENESILITHCSPPYTIQCETKPPVPGTARSISLYICSALS